MSIESAITAIEGILNKFKLLSENGEVTPSFQAEVKAKQLYYQKILIALRTKENRYIAQALLQIEFGIKSANLKLSLVKRGYLAGQIHLLNAEIDFITPIYKHLLAEKPPGYDLLQQFISVDTEIRRGVGKNCQAFCYYKVETQPIPVEVFKYVITKTPEEYLLLSKKAIPLLNDEKVSLIKKPIQYHNDTIKKLEESYQRYKRVNNNLNAYLSSSIQAFYHYYENLLESKKNLIEILAEITKIILSVEWQNHLLACDDSINVLEQSKISIVPPDVDINRLSPVLKQEYDALQSAYQTIEDQLLNLKRLLDQKKQISFPESVDGFIQHVEEDQLAIYELCEVYDRFSDMVDSFEEHYKHYLKEQAEIKRQQLSIRELEETRQALLEFRLEEKQKLLLWKQRIHEKRVLKNTFYKENDDSVASATSCSDPVQPQRLDEQEASISDQLSKLNHKLLTQLENLIVHRSGIKYQQVKQIVGRLGGEIIENAHGGSHKTLKLASPFINATKQSTSLETVGDASNVPSDASSISTHRPRSQTCPGKMTIVKPHQSGHNDGVLPAYHLKKIANFLTEAGYTRERVQAASDEKPVKKNHI